MQTSIISIDNVKVEKLDGLKFYRGLKKNQKLELLIIRDEKPKKINFMLNQFLDGEQ